MVKARKLSRSIHPYPRHRSRTAIAGNQTVCGHNSSSRPILDHLFSKYSHFWCSRSCPRGSSSQRKRTEHRRREQTGLEVDGVCYGQTVPPWGQRLRRCLRSPQICRRGSLFHTGKLRGMASSLSHVIRKAHRHSSGRKQMNKR